VELHLPWLRHDLPYLRQFLPEHRLRPLLPECVGRVFDLRRKLSRFRDHRKLTFSMFSME